MKQVEPDLVVPDVCRHCRRRHERPLRRYRCRNCGRTVCEDGAHDGRAWNRRGELVHLVGYLPERKMLSKQVVRVCGTVDRLDDYDPSDAAGFEAHEEIEVSFDPSIGSGPESPQDAGARS